MGYYTFDCACDSRDTASRIIYKKLHATERSQRAQELLYERAGRKEARKEKKHLRDVFKGFVFGMQDWYIPAADPRSQAGWRRFCNDEAQFHGYYLWVQEDKNIAVLVTQDVTLADLRAFSKNPDNGFVFC